ncbi:Tn3 family transposase [Siccationidurans soli]|uniref:Tn3 family transposase n=1 Tax=Hymenobacter negativus TaxID=2795026 RepID=A0ABS3QNU6_9BACT|nr:Tn3 family transposase [Hymenobacter negativus]
MENTVNWRFSLGNLRRANDAVMAVTSKMPVSRLFQRDPNQLRTSSDGQQYYVAVDSIHDTLLISASDRKKDCVVWAS